MTPSVEPDELEKLRREVKDLRRQLRERNGHAAERTGIWQPSGLTVAALLLFAAVLLTMAFFAGYLPRQKLESIIRAEAARQEQALPRVEVVPVERGSPRSELELPGNLQAITEAPILARADGYLLRRMADIGDRVRANQPLAEIAAPEIEQQLQQARAAVEQAQAGLDQALANYDQGRSNLDLARVTAERWGRLVSQGAVSRQENDQYQSQYRAQLANVQALEKAIAAQKGSLAAAHANVARLQEIQSYLTVKAPFDGVITMRNIDTGALVKAGDTLLFRIAKTEMLRSYINLPQGDAGFVRAGQPAQLTVSSLPGRRFPGAVTRTANALDPATRTLLVEIGVPNRDGALLPGMYAQVTLTSARLRAPVVIPGEALIARPDGSQVAIVLPDRTVHLRKIQIGRDYGDRLEVLDGLEEGDTIILNPGDNAREGARVEPVSGTRLQ